jgi:hypothetical protein
LITWIDDPVYLEEPFIRTSNWTLDPHQNIAPYPCQVVVEVDRPQGTVPHHLPGTNRFLSEFPAKHNLPAEAAKGGTETMYPEYMLKLQAPVKPVSGQ